ncbi:MAG: MBL fold metallo-hydrolase [Phototrophicaceae bacterium]|jgi:L-ascorbate metabolism protein UlaG (beta-lactamase superfamily)
MLHSLAEQIRRVEIQPNSLAVWGMGQVGALLKGTGAIVGIDLYLSNYVYDIYGGENIRNFPPPLEPQDVPAFDYYFITHEHLDHYDPKTIAPILATNPHVVFVTNGWCKQLLLDNLGVAEANILTPTALEPLHLPHNIRVTAVPGAHYGKDYDATKGYRWQGFLIEWNGVTFLHTGDTLWYEGYEAILQGLPKIDLALIPMNGRDSLRDAQNILGNFHPQEAVTLAQLLGVDTVIIGHNDLFPNNRIPFSQVIHALETIHPRQKYKVLQPGELLYYVK